MISACTCSVCFLRRAIATHSGSVTARRKVPVPPLKTHLSVLRRASSSARPTSAPCRTWMNELSASARLVPSTVCSSSSSRAGIRVSMSAVLRRTSWSWLSIASSRALLRRDAAATRPRASRMAPLTLFGPTMSASARMPTPIARMRASPLSAYLPSHAAIRAIEYIPACGSQLIVTTQVQMSRALLASHALGGLVRRFGKSVMPAPVHRRRHHAAKAVRGLVLGELEAGHVVLRLLRVVLTADTAVGAVDAWLVEWGTWAGGRVAWRVRLQRLAGLARRARWAGRVVGQSGTGQAQGEESDYWSNHE